MNDFDDGHSDSVPEPGTDPITDRLRDVGSARIPVATRGTQLRAMHAAYSTAGVPARRTEKRFGRLAVAMAAIVGFVAGTTGLAMAGALPGPAQGAAVDVLSVVGIDAPAAKEPKRGPCVSEAAKLADPVAKQAAKDACPKGPFGNGRTGAPGQDGAPGQNKDKPNGKPEANGRSAEAPGQVDKAADPCRGRPPWAGKNDLTDEEVAAAKAARAACPDDEADEPDELERDELEPEELEPEELETEDLDTDEAEDTSGE